MDVPAIVRARGRTALHCHGARGRGGIPRCGFSSSPCSVLSCPVLSSLILPSLRDPPTTRPATCARRDPPRDPPATRPAICPATRWRPLAICRRSARARHDLRRARPAPRFRSYPQPLGPTSGMRTIVWARRSGVVAGPWGETIERVSRSGSARWCGLDARGQMRGPILGPSWAARAQDGWDKETTLSPCRASFTKTAVLPHVALRSPPLPIFGGARFWRICGRGVRFWLMFGGGSFLAALWEGRSFFG